MNRPHGHHAWVFTPAWARAALTHRVFTGLSRQHLADLIVELADPSAAARRGDVFAYAAAHRVELRIDGIETQVRPPRANRPGRRAFVSGKRKHNTIKTTTISDGRGRWPTRTRQANTPQPQSRTKSLAVGPAASAEVDHDDLTESGAVDL